MSQPSDLGRIPVNAGQAFSFDLVLGGLLTDLASFTGLALTGQIRKDADPKGWPALVTPTITVGSPVANDPTVSVTATIAVSADQMKKIPSCEHAFQMPTSYWLDLEGALTWTSTGPSSPRGVLLP
jgi:hypothetical protein